ncbi:MAG: LysR family transcriptional regulator [Planctomycetia bacterium]|nr:LysR family transcriptional regulator [Planctomycetia bacterium]
MQPDCADDVQLPHLETFAQAAELSSFTAAARTLGLSQAAVSQRVQAIEKSLGMALFRREGGRVLLTEAGRRLHGYARRILELHQEARATLMGQRPPLGGELRLGASSVPGEHLLPAILADFQQRHPDIKVFADISDSLKVIQQVERGKVQLGLVGRKTDNPDLEFQPFAEDRMVLVAPAHHAWAKRRRVPLKQLYRQPLVLREAGSGLRHCFEKALEQQGKSLMDLRVVLELGSNEAIKEAVLRGLGLAVLSTFAVQKELQAGQLAALTVTDLHCDRRIYTVRDHRRVLSAPAQVFLTFLETHP